MHKVMIAIPILGYFITTRLGLFLCEAFRREFQIETFANKHGMAYARNTLCGRFLKSKCDALWMVDHDGLPPKNAFDQVEMTSDVASAIAPINRIECEHPDASSVVWNAFTIHPSDGFVPIYPHTSGIVKCDVIGLASVIIKRKVIVALAEGSTTLPPVFQHRYATNGDTIEAPDVNFCRRVRERGFSIQANTNVRWGHAITTDVAKIYEVGVNSRR
jgi:hypothetical protein